ncbi:hypothetical protein [Candidatus Enterovibrio escicola]|uniref:hypothetical protein n=1 Tax=Candidatus Enterovibrio escicola TaxID=1927127 RepID=UPI001237FE96|nr:hypothetical protein [Candidatus Enterovibrio escacola]
MEKITVQQAADTFYNGNISALARDNELAVQMVTRWKYKGQKFIKLCNGRYLVESQRTQVITTPFPLEEKIEILHFSKIVELVSQKHPELACTEWNPNSKKVLARWVKSERICYRVSPTQWILESDKFILLRF